MKLSKKRIALAVGVAASIGAIAATASGVTFGLYSGSQASGGNAVQSANNPLPGTCTTAGNQCLPGSGFVWS